MNFHDWDSELAQVKRDLSLLERSMGGSRFQETRIKNQQKRVLQKNLEYERRLEELKKILGKDYFLSPREQAILHWSQIYLEKARNFFSLQQAFLTRCLWLKLLKARVLGGELSEKELEQDLGSADIVALGVRYSQLKKTEKHLLQQLALIEDRKKNLKQRYHELGVIEANNIAGRSFYMRFAPNFDPKAISKSLRTIGRGLKNAMWSRSNENEIRDFNLKLEHFDQVTEEVLQDCRCLVLGEHLDRFNGQDENRKERLGEALFELSQLENQVRKAYQKLLRESMPPLRPILVQKKQNIAKREGVSYSLTPNNKVNPGSLDHGKNSAFEHFDPR